MSNQSYPLFLQRNPRLQGILFLVLGALLFKFFAWDVFKTAEKGEATAITYSFGLMALSVIFVLFGAFLAASGPAGWTMLENLKSQRNTKTLKGKIVVGSLILAGAAIAFLIDAQFKRLGYSRH